MRKQKQKNPLRNLSKLQLLELLARQEREIQSLREELAKREEELEHRAIVAQEAGSIAEAALRLSGVFEAAQRAADQYLAGVKQRAERPVHEQTRSEEERPWQND